MAMRRVAVILLSVSACAQLAGLDEFAGSPSASAASGGAAAAGVGGGTTTGSGGAPLNPACLVDNTHVSDRVLARFFLDEADDGQAPGVVRDDLSGDSLALDYAQDAMGFGTDADGNRGLRWSGAGGPGGALTSLSQVPALEQLSQMTQATLELVIHVESTAMVAAVVDIARTATDSGWFTLETTASETRFTTRNRGSPSATWAFGLEGMGRVVWHLVYDSTRATADARVMAFVDGVAQQTSSTAVAMGDTLALPTSPAPTVRLGNRVSDDRSFKGTLYYVAFYGRALTPSEIDEQVQLLARCDDNPTG